MDAHGVPKQPAWGFVKELERPLHEAPPLEWGRRRPDAGAVSLEAGVTLQTEFPDPLALLETAYADFHRFLASVGIGRGPYPIAIRRASALETEAYEIDLSATGCVLSAGDTEGVRRGLVHLEDELLRSGGPLLQPARCRRAPVVRTRLSRCFFGPINRPPLNRDELADDENYYPDEYLNRLAHEGINGLWLTLRFRETCPSRILPDCGRDAERRLAKLRLTIARCARYGIKVYAFAIEPAAFALDDPALTAHPELRGRRVGDKVAFCTASETARAYLREATYNLFTSAPGLGGIILISVGERLTHCWSSRISNHAQNDCPRCCDRQPAAVLAETLTALAAGVHAADPGAEVISWPYSQHYCWGDARTIEAAAAVPAQVALMHNFESGGGEEQLGRFRQANDYWLSYVGPSALYRECATAATAAGTRMFAKLQVSCSHEVATAPFVPVPGILYDKYRAMHALGVSGAMQCWFFGNYPGLMGKAANELSYAPLPDTKREFLLNLARRDWGSDAPAIVEAWTHFEAGYRRLPLSAAFSYYGPMHDGPVWPLHLVPRNLALAPTWKLEYPPSGDRIGECLLDTHTWSEALTLCESLVENWQRGLAVIEALRPKYANHRERRLDLGVYQALGLQFASGLNILRFYQMRETLADRRDPGRTTLLDEMQALVEDELRIDGALLELAEADPRLGFHSEAEGYKYFPAKIRWRMARLNALLAEEFPEVRARIDAGLSAFPAYTGEESPAPTYRAPRRVTPDAEVESGAAAAPWAPLVEKAAADGEWPRSDAGAARWRAWYDADAVYVEVESLAAPAQDGRVPSLPDAIELRIEPRRLWPFLSFTISRDGRRRYFRHVHWGEAEDSYWEGTARTLARGWSARFKIPYVSLGRTGPGPLRCNVIQRGGAGERWIARPPLRSRLIFAAENPDEFGRLLLSSAPST